jgi:hypothetical protein
MYFQHAFDILKGWPNPAAVDYAAKVDPGVTYFPVYSGRIVHVNASGNFEPGAVGSQMPILMIPSQSDFDVTNLSASGANAWYPVSPTQKMSGLVAIGGYEVQTTEYDPTGTFNINDPLHAPVEAQITTGTDKSMAGMLYNKRNWPGGSAAQIVVYTDNVCGVISRIPGNNALRVPVISFWLTYVPCATATA